jgi:hypothetical protein
VDQRRFRTTPKAIEKWFTFCSRHAWQWRPERIRSGLASNCRSLAMNSSWRTLVG